MWHLLRILDLGKQKDTDSWNSLAIQPSLFGEFQANEKACLKKNTKEDRIQNSGTASKLNIERERDQKEINSWCPNPRDQQQEENQIEKQTRGNV